MSMKIFVSILVLAAVLIGANEACFVPPTSAASTDLANELLKSLVKCQADLVTAKGGSTNPSENQKEKITECLKKVEVTTTDTAKTPNTVKARDSSKLEVDYKGCLDNPSADPKNSNA